MARATLAVPSAIFALTISGLVVAVFGSGYTPFLLALVALATVVGAGVNILIGLTGQISIGHIGFYAIGAYVVGVASTNGISFWIALPVAALVAGVIGAMLAVPALRVSGPYLAMMTIAFSFIVEHILIEWRTVTGGQNGLMNIAQPAFGFGLDGERGLGAVAVVMAGAALLFFHRLAESPLGKAMIAVRDSETAAQAVGYNPVVVKTIAFALSATITGAAGGAFASLMTFVAPSSFPFSQSILFLLSVIVGGAGYTLGPVIGALVIVLLPESIASLAEYRLLIFGILLLVVLWLAPEGILGTLGRYLPRSASSQTGGGTFDLAAYIGSDGAGPSLTVSGLTIAFGGVKAATDVAFTADVARVTALIGPNGAGKSTVLNMIGGFYRPDAGRIDLGGADLAGRPAWRVSRAGIARTYQTTQLFGSLSALDNVLSGARGGDLGHPLMPSSTPADRAIGIGLLSFVGYQGDLDTPAQELPHVDRRLVEIARALATRPKALLLDEPAAGLMRADKLALGAVLRRIADAGIAVLLVEHDMALVMGTSDHVVVLDAGRPIAAGAPALVSADAKVKEAYLGSGVTTVRRRPKPLDSKQPLEVDTVELKAGYGRVPVLDGISLEVRRGELVALLGANGAGKSTVMRAMSGLLRPVSGVIRLGGEQIERVEAHRIAARGLSLVPEGRQVFSELSTRENLKLGAYTRDGATIEADIEAMFQRFPRLRERADARAGLLSGGEQQMLAIARGLMAHPRILLLDEPSLGLAPAIIGELFDVIAELRDRGVTLLLVDQMATQALAAADRGYVLESGAIVRADLASTLREDPALEAAYLGGLQAAK